MWRSWALSCAVFCLVPSAFGQVEPRQPVVKPSLRTPDLDCVKVELITEDRGVATVLLRNRCKEAIAAISVRPVAQGLAEQTTTEIDFTVGLGLPVSRVPPPGFEVGLI